MAETVAVPPEAAVTAPIQDLQDIHPDENLAD